jgi:hypothetical protein
MAARRSGQSNMPQERKIQVQILPGYKDFLGENIFCVKMTA